MNKDKELIDALTTSIEMEEKGREFYMKVAEKATNEFGRKVFEALADDEIRHLVAIRECCETILKRDKTPQLCAIMPGHKSIRERIIFGKRESELLKKVSPDADELKAYEVAMQMENDGYNFYKNTLKDIKDPNAKELYNFLLKEEETHFELISNTYEYLKNPSAWFAKEERPIVEG